MAVVSVPKTGNGSVITPEMQIIKGGGGGSTPTDVTGGTIYPSTSQQTILAAGEYNVQNPIVIAGIEQTGLTAENIVSGVTVEIKNGDEVIYSVTGTGGSGSGGKMKWVNVGNPPGIWSSPFRSDYTRGATLWRYPNSEQEYFVTLTDTSGTTHANMAYIDIPAEYLTSLSAIDYVILMSDVDNDHRSEYGYNDYWNYGGCIYQNGLVTVDDGVKPDGSELNGGTFRLASNSSKIWCDTENGIRLPVCNRFSYAVEVDDGEGGTYTEYEDTWGTRRYYAFVIGY